MIAATLVVLCPSGHAENAGVPAGLQVELLSKLEGYDGGFAARAGGTATVLLLVKPGSARSEVSASEMKSALSHVDRIGGLPHREVQVAYAGGAALLSRCRAEHAAVVYVTPGFEDDVAALRDALSQLEVLSLGALSSYVPDGIVLAFDLEAGKPKIVLNLEQARRQGVRFPADLLRLMKVYR